MQTYSKNWISVPISQWPIYFSYVIVTTMAIMTCAILAPSVNTAGLEVGVLSNFRKQLEGGSVHSYLLNTRCSAVHCAASCAVSLLFPLVPRQMFLDLQFWRQAL